MIKSLNRHQIPNHGRSSRSTTSLHSFERDLSFHSRILVKNFTFKKFVLDIPGALEVITTIGFVAVGVEFMEISPDLDLAFLSRTVSKLDQTANVDDGHIQ